MSFVKNAHELAKTPERKIILELVEAAFSSIQPKEVFKTNIKRHGNTLTIVDKEFNLDEFERVFIVGFGKGSAGNSKLLEDLVLDKLTAGYVIDTNPEKFSKIEGTVGTHPLPSEENMKFTQKVLEKLTGLTEKDLVLVVICGGGSAMFVHPHAISLEQKIIVGKALLKSGANITEMNVVRKHLSDVKGGGFAQILYPATIATLVYSDVPGNELSTIASGPTTMDNSTIHDAMSIIEKYKLGKELRLTKDAFVEKPHEQKYFKNVHNIIVLSNETALHAMFNKAKELKKHAKIFSDRMEGEAKLVGKKLISATPHNSILLVGGETTVKVVKNGGQGGRNQELVLAALNEVRRDVTICSFDSDGWDNSEAAGAIGDYMTIEHEHTKKIDPQDFLDIDDSLDFFAKTGDAITTGRLPSNVSDLMIVIRK